ncbi:YifB family Mg chelatase-like AAA ATPase [Alkalimarinus alittae]|uniref:YifB family Mg chelatase-like AAA ATPase n=1 Tax=Alkalimarinus alittae TaxID=2961619 RepID=A0ABY6N1P1_9ALTE|nr:YifB family Mg chelatase-like AAA ATPase [Alkalimarinus alittae]UZE95950.1 YifB family Mg chelatase-like AAA ATPase [Alkalimarinus alittae]
MSLSIIYSRARVGVSSPLVTVETHISNGLPSLSIVGLPETAVKESKDRVRSALINSGFEFPNRRITINLAPADLPKEGGRYDLAIALGILAASHQLPAEPLVSREFIGELALTGDVRSVKGCLPAAMACGKEGRTLYVPSQNSEEASLCRSTRMLAADHLLQVCSDIKGDSLLPELAFDQTRQNDGVIPDLLEVKGQFLARRALEIAAAASLNLLFYGPPGTGKSMLASRLPGILPGLTESEALEVAAIHSIGGQPVDFASWGRRPFRTPHHTASAVALVGGGSSPKPGEISLAHNGVLFLDELPEYSRKVLEVLREPLESGHIAISRAASQITFPARFQLVAAMNPCPCGYHGHPSIECTDTPQQVIKYRQKLSGPLLDRFDMHVEVPAQAADVLIAKSLNTESSETVRKRVLIARDIQFHRSGKANRELSGTELEEVCKLNDQSRSLLENAMNRLGLSARAFHRVLRVARTIADLQQAEVVSMQHITEALGYRKLDRKAT